MINPGLALAFGLVIALGSPTWAEPEALNSSDFGQVSGFAATALLTDDRDWREKWDTDPATSPHYHLVSDIDPGEVANLLVFFANPAVKDGKALIGCDLEVDRPHGMPTIQPGIVCYDAPIFGPVGNYRMAGLRLEFRAEIPTDDGVWQAKIVVRDMIRDVSVPLRIRFRIVMEGGT
jgi:hypothetical protein